MKYRSIINLFAIIALLILSASCTGIGVHMYPPAETFGQMEVLRIGIYQSSDLSDANRDAAIAAMQEEFLKYNIDIQIPFVRQWERKHFKTEPEMREFLKLPMDTSCDRQMLLLGRNVKDVLYGLTLMPEYLGFVDDDTGSKGLAVAEWGGSLNSLLLLKPPAAIVVHETYHLLGCGHQLNGNTCDDIIREMKAAARENRAKGSDFFPSRNLVTGRIITERH